MAYRFLGVGLLGWHWTTSHHFKSLYSSTYLDIATITIASKTVSILQYCQNITSEQMFAPVKGEMQHERSRQIDFLHIHTIPRTNRQGSQSDSTID